MFCLNVVTLTLMWVVGDQLTLWGECKFCKVLFEGQHRIGITEHRERMESCPKRIQASY